MLHVLKNIYLNEGGMENVFQKSFKDSNLQLAITNFKEIFFSIEHQSRTEKHIGDPSKNSAAKKINIIKSVVYNT